MSRGNDLILKPRKAWAAVALSLLAAGAGQVYCGRLGRGLALFAGALAATVAAGAAAMAARTPVAPAAVALLLAAEAVGLYAAVDAWLCARRAPWPYALRPCNRAWVYAALIALGTVAGAVAVHVPARLAWGACRMASDSMAPTLVKGDRVLVNRGAYRHSGPSRGEVVALAGPATGGRTYIQRVVALAGDAVEVRQGRLYVDGRPAEAEAAAAGAGADARPIAWERAGETRYCVRLPPGVGESPDLPRTVVPPGCCFTLGDNRGAARDGRHFGPVPLADVQGKVTRLYWPADTWDRAGPLE